MKLIYSDDEDIAKYSRRVNIDTVKTDDLPIPEAARQQNIAFKPE